MLKTEKFKFATGKELEVLKEGLTTGRRILNAEGYIQCPNNLFMQKGNSIVHYNKSMKVWIFKEAICE